MNFSTLPKNTKIIIGVVVGAILLYAIYSFFKKDAVIVAPVVVQPPATTVVTEPAANGNGTV